MLHVVTPALLALTLLVATVPPLAAQEGPPSKAAPATAAAPVNVNTASAAQLEALPGIGQRVAERIVEYRTKNGPFKKVEDLMNVQGIGEKSFLKLKPMLTVAPTKDARGGAR